MAKVNKSIIQGNTVVAWLSDASAIGMLDVEVDVCSKFAIIIDTGWVPQSFVFRNSSHLLAKKFATSVEKLQKSGILAKWEKDYNMRLPDCSYVKQQTFTKANFPTKAILAPVAGICIGYGVGLLIFCAEICYRRFLHEYYENIVRKLT